MSPAPEYLIRFGTPADAATLFELEQRYFPAVPGEYHAGFLYGSELAPLVLTEEISAPKRSFTIVAESEGKVIGFAAAVPSRLPGSAQIDGTAMLLNYVAVEPERRGEGIGRALVAEIERRSLAARQNVIVAHLPPAEAAFYRRSGWEVLPEQHGFAWLPFNDHLRADDADPALGFSLMAAKVLRPRALRTSFAFPAVRNLPVLDASVELRKFIDDGRIDVRDLDPDTRAFVNMAPR